MIIIIKMTLKKMDLKRVSIIHAQNMIKSKLETTKNCALKKKIFIFLFLIIAIEITNVLLYKTNYDNEMLFVQKKHYSTFNSNQFYINTVN